MKLTLDDLRVVLSWEKDMLPPVEKFELGVGMAHISGRSVKSEAPPPLDVEIGDHDRVPGEEELKSQD